MTSGQHGHADDVSRSDIEALGATRAELGKDYEEALLDSFADRVEQTIDRRVSSELARRNQGYGMVSPSGQPGYPTTGYPAPSTGNGAHAWHYKNQRPEDPRDCRR